MKRKKVHHVSHKAKKSTWKKSNDKTWHRSISFLAVMILVTAFGVFCWMVKEMVSVGVLGISVAR